VPHARGAGAPARALAPTLWAANRSLAARVRVLALDNPPADACALDADCAYGRFIVARNAAFMRAMAGMTPGSAYAQVNSSAWLGDGASPVEEIAARIVGFA